MKVENRVVKSGLKKANVEIEGIKRHGEYDEEKSRMQDEFRNVRREWRTAYYCYFILSFYRKKCY